MFGCGQSKTKKWELDGLKLGLNLHVDQFIKLKINQNIKQILGQWFDRG